jgi:hypothetical protein
MARVSCLIGFATTILSGFPRLFYPYQGVLEQAQMLKDVGLNYFNKGEAEITPTDLIELDYRRKLEYVSEIKLNNK